MLPAKEIKMSNRFTISQLYLLIQELRNLTNDSEVIDSKLIFQYFIRRIVILSKLYCYILFMLCREAHLVKMIFQ